MNSLFGKLLRNRNYQDFVGITRGLYKIFDGATSVMTSRGTIIYADSKMMPKARQLLKPDPNGTLSEQINISQLNKPLRPQQTTFPEQYVHNQLINSGRLRVCMNETQKQRATSESLGDQSLQQQNLSIFMKKQAEHKLNQEKQQKIEELKTSLYQQSVEELKKNKYEDLSNFRKALKYQIQESHIPSTSLGRAYEFGKLGVGLVGDAMTSFVKAKLNLGDSQKSYFLNEKNAKRITNTLCKMRGAPLKLAQALSIQEDKLIPKQIRKAFQRARDQAHIIPQNEISYMMTKNFGQDYSEKYFQSFSTKPFAACSIGQVHEGVLKSGQKVAVKIQYPRVAESVDSDLKNLQRVMNLTGFFPKNLFMERIIENTRKQLHQECDYVVQKQKQDRYRQMLKDQPKYYVPKTIGELCTKQILTSEYVEGLSLNELEDFPQVVRDEIATRVMALTFRELFDYKFMQTDPNPSNYSYNIHTDKLNLIDYGAARSYEDAFLDYYWQVIKGAVRQDNNLIWKASIGMGFVTGEQNTDMKKAHIASIKIIAQPFKFSGDFDFGSETMTSRIYETIPIMLRNRLQPPPPDVYSLHRKLSGSYLLCIRLKAKVNCKQIYEKLESSYKIHPAYQL